MEQIGNFIIKLYFPHNQINEFLCFKIVRFYCFMAQNNLTEEQIANIIMWARYCSAIDTTDFRIYYISLLFHQKPEHINHNVHCPQTTQRPAGARILNSISTQLEKLRLELDSSLKAQTRTRPDMTQKRHQTS